jgi:hypothetical protein
MEDPGLWVAFGVTVALGYLLFAPMQRRRETRGRAMVRHGRGG